MMAVEGETECLKNLFPQLLLAKTSRRAVRRLTVKNTARSWKKLRGPEKIERLAVSTSGDLAYDYGATPLEFDDAQTGTHVSFTPTHPRVWKREKGVWKLAAAFMRPNPSKICTE